MHARMLQGLLVAAVALLVFACRPKPAPGVACKTNGQIVCVDATRALACRGGVYATIACKGQNGCRGTGGTSTCDESVAAEGEACVESAVACTADKSARLACVNGTFRVKDRCRGAGACEIQGSRVRCDTSIAADGDPCSGSRSACSADGETLLACKNEVMRAAKSCRGPQKCTLDAAKGKLRCDESVAMVGDPCEGARTACSTDGKAELECRGGAFASVRACACKSGSCALQQQPAYVSDCDYGSD